MNYVYIGRFQPFHNGHKAIVDLTVKLMNPGDTFTVIIGSADQEKTLFNPLTVQQRLDIVREALKCYPFIEIDYLNDSPYDYRSWVFALAKKLGYLLDDGYVLVPDSASLSEVCFVGMENVDVYAHKLQDTFMLSNSNCHIFTEDETKTNVHGSAIRAAALEEKQFYEWLSDYVSQDTLKYLRDVSFKETICKAFETSSNYATSTGCKYNSCFLTVDNIVIDKETDKVLLIKRKDNNKLALPGGFAEPYMTAKANALRELTEETGLDIEDIEPTDIQGALIDAPFRDPRSSNRCNLVSLVYKWFTKSSDSLSKASAADDAADVVWITCKECENLPASAFHADHKKILCKVLGIDYFKS